MTWTSKSTQTQLTSITTEQYFATFISLNPGEVLHGQVKVTFPGSPTDSAIISLYTTLDASSEVWDTTAFRSYLLDKGTSPGYLAFSVSGIYKCRVGVKRSGTTDTLTSADMGWRTDGVTL